MGVVATNAGELQLLQDLLIGIEEDKILRLFKNDYSPDSDSEGSGFEECQFVECDFSNYAPMTLSASNWNTAEMDGRAIAFYGDSPLAFTCNGSTGNVVFGYFLETPSGNLVCAERCFASIGRVMKVDDVLFIKPQLDLYSLV